MKKTIYLIAILAIFSFSCNEDKWLDEVAFDFYSPENSFTTSEQFNSAVARLYASVNWHIFYTGFGGSDVYHYTADIAHYSITTTHELSSYVNNLTPESAFTINFWKTYYRIIYDANVIIQRIDGEKTEFKSENERNILKAEAMFFRAYAYRNLGILYGGVPIILDESTAPKRDFVRASRAEVWAQCISDLTYAATNLPKVTELMEDGRLTKAAANHLLTELYIIVKDYDKAIKSASIVINDQNYSLMTERFGTRKDEPGDAYWDLFRRGNQNRHGKGGGNTESIWVAQYEYMATGGGRGRELPRSLIPLYWQLKDDDGVNLFIGPSTQYGGRGIGFMAPTEYFLNKIWENDPNDMRNSEYNIIRDIAANNPKSSYYKMNIVESGSFANFSNYLNRYWTAIIAKAAPINNFPAEAIVDPLTGLTNTSAAITYRDDYYMRLAETYLLRAEAYYGKGDKAKAAADINVVRARAKAIPVEAEKG